MDDPRSPADAFAAALQRCAPGAFEAFVVDLYGARGWKAERGTDRVRVTREVPPGDSKVLGLDIPSEPDETDLAAVDAVVTARQLPSANRERTDHVTPDDLHRMLRFAVDRSTAEALVGDHLDVSPGAVLRSSAPAAGDGRSSPGGSGQVLGETHEPSPAMAVVPSLGAALVLVLVVVAAVGASSGPVETVDALADPVTESSVPEPVEAPNGSPSPAPPSAGDRLPDQSRYLSATPSCDRPPGLVVAVIVGALGAAGPERADGIDAAWRFSIPIGSEPGFERFLGRPEFEPLFDHETAAYGPVLDHGGDVVSQRVRLSSPTATRSYRFFLTRQGFGDRAACWFLAGILVDDARTSRPAF